AKSTALEDGSSKFAVSRICRTCRKPMSTSALFALLRLVHLRIALLLPVLGRSGCVQDGRVHDRAGRDSHSLRLQVQVHLPQDLFPQLAFFQQVPELAHRVSSGTGSQPRSMPTNCRIPPESYSASSTAG